ncbi:NACHT, LRR and PYD domains-containing protein 10-like isoform X3 [Centruroides sculpturatus]|uniref:NACHT, LRR and PYD domains-containing protein 10-like isoform X3 n=1 Tax=Centruroides sculpturatus TaxID=218467 RepID=UPI000C6E545C|nr:NACHT, LRR and PYD domains-containing protein 10-like isoform X3 [Centruroides sculpturatus]
MIQIQRESLMNYYKTKNAYMMSLLWSITSEDFPLKDYFVELTVQKADLLGKKARETIQLREIFPKSIQGHVLLVTGNPGYGKTTFCKKIAYDWGTDTSRTDYLGHYDFIVVITLRELEKKSITDEILQCICENTDSNSRDKLRQRGFNILIILDGFDETNHKDSIIQFIEKDSFHISKEMTILVTCRPHAAENIRKYAHMRFAIRGFSQEQKEKYIKLIINDDNGRRDELLNLIKYSNFHSALAECPLMLHMLCCLPKTK